MILAGRLAAGSHGMIATGKYTSMKDLKELFPFDYIGTGYFRLKGVPKGTSATEYSEDGVGILHGMQAIEYLYKRMKEDESNLVRGSDSHPG